MAKAKKGIFLLLVFGCVSFLSFQVGSVWGQILVRGKFDKFVVHVFQDARLKAAMRASEFDVKSTEFLAMNVTREIEGLIPVGAEKDKLLNLLSAEFQFENEENGVVCGKHLVPSWVSISLWYRLCLTFEDEKLVSLTAWNMREEGL